MHIIHRSQIPVAEGVLRADLAVYQLELVAHSKTVGVPAPLPAYELLGILASDFLVEDDPIPEPEPPPTAAQLIMQVKAEAQRRIYSILPQWKQANLTARGVELNTKFISGGILTQAEKDEMAAGLILWEKVKAIRAASDLIESDILSSIDPASIDIAASTRWPV